VNITASAAWTDVNKDDIAQGSPGCVYLTPGCEINFANVPKNFGVISLASPDPNIKRPYVDQINLGATHQIMNGVSVTGGTVTAFTGRLAALASCGTSTRQARTVVHKGRFSVHIGLPKGCAVGQHVRVKVSWAGSATFAKARATRSVRAGR